MSGATAVRVSVMQVLRRRTYWPFFLGNLLSNSGTWFQAIAQVLLVYRLTHSTFWVGVVNFAQFAAVIFLAPVAGSAADRFDRRKLIITTQVCATILAGALSVVTALGNATTGFVISIALGLGVIVAISSPALQAMVVSLVPREELSVAVALTATTHNLARVFGPIAAVLVVARWGLSVAFALNALSYLVLIAALMFRAPGRTERPVATQETRLRDSFRLVRGDRRLYVPLVVVALVSLAVDPVNTLTPAFSTEILGRPDTFIGYLVGAFGAGAVLSTLLLVGKREPSFRMISVTLAIMGGGMVAFALSKSEVAMLVSLFCAGFGYLLTVSGATSLLHLSLEDAHRGRVMALWTLAFIGVRPVASAIDGGIAELAGIRLAGILMALPALAGFAWLAIDARRTGALADSPNE